ncbi:translin isoform X2 [Callorhinchus milii]|uniref:translin isoform X2 n=1 Tax=Callorhinchus milii TaxID=7868 RepID=UPI001C3F6084|nr:translin isoform X2 [Callorhinchus milii]
MSVGSMFSLIQASLSSDQDIREEIRKVVQLLEQTAREILTLLQTVHQTSGFKDIPNKCQKARVHFETVKTLMVELKTKFPIDQYYRFNEHWRFVLQRLVFLAAFVVYLESETLVSREVVAEILGVETGAEQRDGWRLLPASSHLLLYQRARLRLSAAQPEERLAAQALRRPQVRREEDRGGGLRPVHPGARQSGQGRRRQGRGGGKVTEGEGGRERETIN